MLGAPLILPGLSTADAKPQLLLQAELLTSHTHTSQGESPGALHAEGWAGPCLGSNVAKSSGNRP